MKALRHKSVNLAGVMTLFLGIFSIPLAATCIWVAILGDPTQLPSKWRELLAAAGVITLVLSIKLVVRAYIRVLERAPEAAAPAKEPRAIDREP